MNETKLILTLAALLTAGGVSGDPRERFSEWDSDGNGRLSETEWQAGFDDMGLFALWDTDGDGGLSEQEWRGFENKAVFDEDFLNRDEVGFELWDRDEDGLLDPEETARGFYDVFSRNDGAIGEEEFETFGSRMGEAGFWQEGGQA